MGRDKAFLPVGGYPVVERVIKRVESLSDDVMLIANAPDKYRHLGHRVVGDVIPGKGALGGIYTAIRSARYLYCLVVACDMPFLNTSLLRHLSGLAPGFDVVVPLLKGSPETMHAVYGQGCLEPIEKKLLSEHLRISGFFDEVRVRYVERRDLSRLDPKLRSFLNMNTPADWEQVQHMVEER
jgi:molybdopterin-guanine dinucleotide biosynthesis protein A